MPLGFILQPTVRMRAGAPVVLLHGRLEDGRPFLVEDDRARPSFFVPAAREDEARALAGGEASFEPSRLRDFRDAPLVRAVLRAPDRVPAVRHRLEEAGIPVCEGDVRFVYAYLMARGIRGALRIEGPGLPPPPGAPARAVRFHNPEVAPASWRPRLSVLSLDLETSPDASRIRAAALASEETREVHLLADRPVAGATAWPDERALLEAVVGRIRALDPDVLTGWNVVDFDLRVLDRRCRRLGVPCALGRAAGAVGFQRDSTYTRQSRASLPGRMVLDGIELVRDALRLDDYRLETVAREVLGRGKRIDAGASDRAAEIDRLWREDPEALAAYNLEDARLVLEILEREGLLALAVERSLLSGMQLDRVGASIASFDLAYLPALHERGFAAPSVARQGEHAPVRGGAVLDSQPGLHRSVAVFDFRSLYPSLMRTFNLDPLAHAQADRDADPLVAPNGAAFSRHEGILPAIVERFLAGREQARRRGDRHAEQALKIMTNSLFGVLGSPACRFFDPEVANAITGFGQQTLAWTRTAFEQEGARVLYGDTDSVFVQLRTDEPRREALALRARVQARIGERVRKTYRVESRLELALQRVFSRLWMPRLRRGPSGSKKRYAGLDEEGLTVVGLEAVRRDWPPAARRLQLDLLERLLRGGDVEEAARRALRALRAGELDADLVITKRVRKGALERYTAARAPHVEAARRAGGAPGGHIRYVVTAGGPEPVLPGRPFPVPDRNHYRDRVFRPLAEPLLREAGSSFERAAGSPHQLDLL